MDQWNGNVRVPYNVPRPAHENPLSFLYNCNYDHFPVLEMKQPPPTIMQATAPHQQHDPPLFPTLIDNKNQLLNYGVTDMAMDHHMIYDSSNNISIYHNDPKKKRLSNEQLESLENSFQEEIKLDPERKQRLAKELGLQPRQIAVWFQNRRARWKAKQLERLYDVLKQEYDAVSKEKHKLQQEVLALRAILKDQVVMSKKLKQVSTEISNDETVESTSIPSDNKPMNTNNITTTTDNIIINNNDNNSNKQIADQSNYPLDDYNHVMMAPYNNWSAPA